MPNKPFPLLTSAQSIFRRFGAHFLFAFIALGIMAPLLYQQGFVFLLDMVWAPQQPLSDIMSDGLRVGLPFSFLLWLLGSILSPEIIQKILLTFILFLCGFLMFDLARKIFPRHWAILSGLFFMLNPWVYERFLAGHWKVLLGYALLPLIVKLFLVLLEKQTLRNLLVFSVAFALSPMASLHWTYISFFFLATVSASHMYLALSEKMKYSSEIMHEMKRMGKGILIFLSVFFLMNSLWIGATLGQKGVLGSITLHDFQAFATVSDPVFGAYFNVLSLYGFWQDNFFLPKDTFALWWVPTVIVLMLSAFGVAAAWNTFAHHKKITHPSTHATLTLAITISFIPAMLIATGYARPETRAVVDFLAQWIPAFKGLRETMKVAGLLAFFYALLIPMGSLAIWRAIVATERTKKTLILSRTLFTAVAIIPLLWAGGFMLWGFNGQLSASSYPIGWYEVKRILSSQKHPDQTLFLPWHAYPRVDFAQNRRVANPGKVFFGSSATVGKNIDSVFYEIQQQQNWDTILFRLLNDMESPERASDFFASEGIQQVILAKIDDFDRYSFLSDSTVFEPLFEDESIVLYRLRPKEHKTE